jgi:hypothetical protein
VGPDNGVDKIFKMVLLHLNLPSPSHKTITITPTVETTLAHVVAKPNRPELLHHQSSEFGIMM